MIHPPELFRFLALSVPASASSHPSLLALLQPFEGGQAFGNLVKVLLVDGVDRHLWAAKKSRVVECADFQDHGRQAGPPGQDMRAAFGAEFPRHGALKIAACKLFGRPL